MSSPSSLTPIKVLIPLPAYGFDPTESGVPFKYLSESKLPIEIVFTTPDGLIATADQIMVTGVGLGLLSSTLMADSNGLLAYNQMINSAQYKNPIKYSDINITDYQALLLPGGHDTGMRTYLDSTIVQNWISVFFDRNLPIAAICHGTLAVARSKQLSSAGLNQSTKSVLYGRKTTGLLRAQELFALYLTFPILGRYYQTYPEFNKWYCTYTMNDELKSYLQTPDVDFISGPVNIVLRIPIDRDNPTNPSIGYSYRDKNYLSARWPGDAHKFSLEFIKLLEEYYWK